VADLPVRADAAAALADLIAGNRRFAAGRPRHGHHIAAAAAASGTQQPYAAVLGCIDSRVPLEAVFDQTFGSICVIRSGAHVLDLAVLGSIEFAVERLGVPLVMVLGHDRCGAVGATVDALREQRRAGSDALDYLLDQIAPAVDGIDPAGPDAVRVATRVHVLRTVHRLRERHGAAHVVGALYDLDTGQVDTL
jgi:carbonic anhydrase